MGLSVGGQSGNQSGYQSGNSSFGQTGSSSGTQTGSTTGTTSGTTSGSTGVLTTPTYNLATSGAAGALGGNGFTAPQQQAIDRQSGAVAGQPMGFALQGVNGQLQDFINGGGIPAVTASPVGAPDAVKGYTAASYMDPYRGTYAQDVLNPSLALFDQNTGSQYAGLRASRDAGSAFGDRAALADNDFFQKQALARSNLAGNILGTGYTTALGAGQSDAGNATSASGQTAANQLAANEATAVNALQASMATAANALAGRTQVLNALGMKAGNDVNTNSIGLDNNQALYNMGGGSLDNYLKLAGSQVPAFGGTSTGSTSGTTSGSTSGNYSGATANNGTGGYSGFNSGSSSSKGGGIG